MPRDYKKIASWQRAHGPTLAVYQATQAFPKHELYGLTSQVRRAAMSVATNIVEGSGRNSRKEYLHFLYIAYASLKETQYLLLLAHDLGYLGAHEHSTLTGVVDGTFAPLHGLIKVVKKEAGVIAGAFAWLTSGATLLLGGSMSYVVQRYV